MPRINIHFRRKNFFENGSKKDAGFLAFGIKILYLCNTEITGVALAETKAPETLKLIGSGVRSSRRMTENETRWASHAQAIGMPACV